MGIPSYFSHIVKNHNIIIKKYEEFLKTHSIDNLYLDSNSIIYDSYRIMIEEHNHLNKIKFENKLISIICNKIETYINIIKPTFCIYIAFDGVAPVAKMNQQRSRRYKSNFEKKIVHTLKNNNNIDLWDKTCITPGTQFMNKLGKGINNFFKNKENKYNVEKIIISTTNEPGEGEHKLFNYIRTNKFLHYSRSTVVYGLDADLIMLAINHLQFCKNIFLFRETPEFIKSIDSTLNPNYNYILDIPLLSYHIKLNMNITNKTMDENILQDYIFIFFLLGNDFLPHFPSLNIRTKGIENILNAYNNTISNKNITIINNNNINWKHLNLFIQYLSTNELLFIKNEYNIRNKKENRTLPNTNYEEKYKKYLLTPIYNRNNEKYINPYEKFWENRYYTTLFHFKPTRNNIKNVCINYLEGLEWTFKYYNSSCPDWHWKYNYHYPPLFKDLIKYIPSFNCNMINENKNEPVNPYIQLIYVLPKDSLHFLPKNIYNKVITELIHLYPENADYIWDFCTYIWESHIDLPNMNIEHIQNIIHPLL